MRHSTGVFCDCAGPVGKALETSGRRRDPSGNAQEEPMAPDSATLSSSRTAGQKVAHGRIAEPVLVKGRRDFFTYRDLGVAEGSAGIMRAQVMKATQGLSEPTGWHYHECDGQFIYIMKGWVELQFEDGRTIKVEEGDSLFIPGYLRHNETRTSDEMEILEVSIPGELGTRPCDPPEGFKA
jgi:mannose-6-phosphate isomerase-like protein (cupin superfamily)